MTDQIKELQEALQSARQEIQRLTNILNLCNPMWVMTDHGHGFPQYTLQCNELATISSGYNSKNGIVWYLRVKGVPEFQTKEEAMRAGEKQNGLDPCIIKPKEPRKP